MEEVVDGTPSVILTKAATPSRLSSENQACEAEDREKRSRMFCSAFSGRRSLVVDVLCVVYGLGSWIAMTGLWVELPLLVQRLPEGWSLGSTLTLALQVANVGPVAYGLLNERFPRAVTERSGTHAQMVIGAVSTLLLIFLWSVTVPLGSSRISLPLYVLSFGLSVVDCTSSVVFLPYMANFRSIYLVPYLVGEGLSGLLPSLVASGQGIGEQGCHNVTVSTNGSNDSWKLVPWVGDPRFEPEWFFTFLLAMVLISWLAFGLLDNLALCKREMVKDRPEVRCPAEEEYELKNPEVRKGSRSATSSLVSCKLAARMPKKGVKYYYLLVLQCWASIATFGVFPPIQSYSCLPYGNGPFHYAVTLGGVAYPVACLAAMFVESRSLRWISVLATVANAISVFILYTAVMSPNPPLVGSQLGGPLIVVSWVAFIGLFSYVKTMVTVLLGEVWGQRALFWCGAVTQAGAAAGALLMFLVVNVFQLLQDDQQC